MRYLISFSYDGSCFDGFQKQNSKKTVQGELEKALSELEEKQVKIHASGRTDKGVHAKDQKAHFDLDKNVKLYNLKKYLNRKFSGEIYVNDIKEVDNNFHARYNVKSKTYTYYINTKEFNPIKRNYIYQYCNDLDIESMKKASGCLIGKHDFKSFCSDSSKENTIRTITSIDIKEKEGVISITFTGDGFLRKMIRNIVAILIEIGSNKKDISYMKEMLDNKVRTGNLKCANPEGLYLEKVKY